MKYKSHIILCLFFLLFISGCNTTSNSTSPQNNNSTTTSNSLDNGSSLYVINNEIKPQIINDSINYKNSELTNLNKKINFKAISDLYFLDNSNIIYSVINGKNSANDNENSDLYKYDLENNILTLLAPDYTLYSDSYIVVKDSSNFSIISNDTFLTIKDNSVKVKRNFFNEVKSKYPYVTAAFYNEENDKILILENDLITKNFNAYITDNQISSPLKLPFSNIYRVQWADKDNVLVAYKESNSKSLLATYNLSDKSTKITTFPDKNYFIDPIMSDNSIIRFLYLDNANTEKPWGFLDLNKGTIDRVFFESSNPTSIVRNGRMAGFSQKITGNNKTNKLFLYDNLAKKITIRNDSVEYPQHLAVSPDGNTIVFVAGNPAGESRFYINRKA